MPVSAAVEFGRLILPKSDMPMKIFNQSNTEAGFEYALTINERKE